MTKFSPLLASAVLAIVLGGCASTSPVATTTLPDQPGLPLATSLPDSHVPAAIPVGFVAFCLRYSDQCELPKNSPVFAHLDSQTFALMTQVNRATNIAIQPEGDDKHYGLDDY